MKFHHLHLKTTPLEAMRRFYIDQLGFPLVDSGPDHFVMQAGHTEVRFDRAHGDPCYHFAFNIPSPDIESAASWLRTHHEILDWNGKEVIDFSDWNAEAVYFKDPAGNIGEFIARKNPDWPSEAPFDATKVRSISEMGLPTTDMVGIDAALAEQVGLKRYDCDISRFCAIGDEEGLFIVIDHRVKKWIPKMDPAIPFPFKASITHDGTAFELAFENSDAELISDFQFSISNWPTDENRG